MSNEKNRDDATKFIRNESDQNDNMMRCKIIHVTTIRFVVVVLFFFFVFISRNVASGTIVITEGESRCVLKKKKNWVSIRDDNGDPFSNGEGRGGVHERLASADTRKECTVIRDEFTRRHFAPPPRDL